MPVIVRFFQWDMPLLHIGLPANYSNQAERFYGNRCWENINHPEEERGIANVREINHATERLLKRIAGIVSMKRQRCLQVYRAMTCPKSIKDSLNSSRVITGWGFIRFGGSPRLIIDQRDDLGDAA